MRPATAGDSDLILAWRNSPEAIRFSGTGRAVDPDEHHDWLSRRLNDPHPRLWIGEVDGEPVGQVRLDLQDGEAEVSIAVAPEARGQGRGQALLEELKKVAAADSSVERLVALVHPDNSASSRLFEAAGFETSGREGAMNRLVWRAVSSGVSSSGP